MFRNRTHAGEELAAVVRDHDRGFDVVLAVPRGGLPVGRVVADALGVPLDVVVARKIGARGNPELALGAVASDGTTWLNESLIDDLGVAESYVAREADRERATAAEKLDRYRGDRPPLDVAGKRVLIVDDGIATGATTTACVRQLRNAGAEYVAVAVPVASPSAVERLADEADAVSCVDTPPHFSAVGQFYDSFEQVSDEEAGRHLGAARE
ncbi:phosphoribosyltransferase [Haloparvum sedimenti]|uniref:phosphoribosyltransferase n=1 Tax=Haloparvum sedimenti TaxID=1678448 RepID=UPI00071E9449|nr:phosphoribosyltransferase family protein [Haloparvum sedimenti]